MGHLFTYLTAAFACLATSAAAEGPNRLSVLLGSHHLNAKQSFEQTNPGLFLDWVRPDGVTVSFGGYRNSFGKPSIAAMAGLKLFESERTRIDLFGGVAHYPGDGRKNRFAIGDLTPLVGLRAEHRGLFVLALPGDGQATDAIFGFGLSMDLPR